MPGRGENQATGGQAGAVDQFTDSTDAAGDLGFLRACTATAIGKAGKAPVR